MNADLLRAKFKERRKTQAEIASLIGISDNSLSRKLTGKREFRLSEVAKLCEVLDIDDPTQIFLPDLSQIRNEKDCSKKPRLSGPGRN